MSIRFAVPAVRDLGRDLEQIETFRLQYPEDATRQFNDQSFKSLKCVKLVTLIPIAINRRSMRSL